MRRLFQIPDAFDNAANLFVGGVLNPPTIEPAGTEPTAASVSPSNAGETGDPTLNLLVPYQTMTGTNPPVNPPAGSAFIVPQPAPGALRRSAMAAGPRYGALTNSVVNLYWPSSAATATGNSAAPRRPCTLSPPGRPPPAANNEIGSTTSPTRNASHYLGSAATATRADNRQHPYWRTEHLQRIINQTTVRTHQYAVWITIGFFQVKRQGDLGMFATSPQLAFDIMGPEIGAANGKTTRYRGFMLVDRLQLAGFNPATTSNFRAAVVYRKRIQ